MDQLKITEQLHRRDRKVANATPFCPGSQDLAAFLHGALEEEARESFRRHLAACRHCRARLGVMARARQDEGPVTIREDLLQQAIDFGQPARRPVRWRMPAVAAAGVAALAIALSQGPFREPRGGDSATPLTEPSRSQRNLEQISPAPAILLPAEGSRVPVADLQVWWTRVPGSLYYDIRLLDAAGFVVWEDRLSGTQSAIPPGLPLVQGERYFVRVDAYLAESKSVGSSHVSFIVGDIAQ